jgi:hypothetical protein
VELWRADLMAAVLDLDMHGVVESVGIKDQPSFNPQLMLGLPTDLIVGEHTVAQQSAPACTTRTTA